MTSEALLLLLGLALLVAGGRALVEGASQLAGVLGVSELTIGLTVVAFGTSAPELGVNTLAAVQGNTEIAFGNVVGSNVANIALVIGLCALIRPLPIESVIVSREIPMMLLATLAVLVLGFDRVRGGVEAFDRTDGLLLLLLFSIFLYYTISEVVGTRRTDLLATDAARGTPRTAFWTTGRAAALGAAGLVILLLGAQLAVSNAVSLAEALGVPGVVIGLTVVALGTSLPELTTSVVATWRGQASLAVGNVVGSNIFNLLFIMGVTSAIRPVEVPVRGGAADLLVLAVLSAALLLLSRTRGAQIGRSEGVLLVAAYAGYVAWRLSA